MFSKAEVKRKARLHDKEEKATSDASLDGKTRLCLFKWINVGLFDRVEEVIAIGKVSKIGRSHFTIRIDFLGINCSSRDRRGAKR